MSFAYSASLLADSARRSRFAVEWFASDSFRLLSRLGLLAAAVAQARQPELQAEEKV